MSDPCLIEGLSFADYVAMPGVNASSLRGMLVSPLAYKRGRDIPREDTDSMRIGRAAHTLILEPGKFDRQYAFWTGGRRAGKEWDAFTHNNEGRTILTGAQLDVVQRIHVAATNHAVAGGYLLDRGKAEVVLTWQHQRTGLDCKARLDWLVSDAIVDLKTTRDPSPAKFSADAARLGIVMQLAWYVDGAHANLGQTMPAKIIAVQNCEPFDVVVYDVPPETLAIGHSQFETALDRLLECRATNRWPGLAPHEEVTLHLPAWAGVVEDDAPLTFGGEAFL